MSLLEEYFLYHKNSVEIGDVDPAYPMMDYLCNRFELNTEQRYWLAFLYSLTYCGPTAYAIYNRFPDYETVSEWAVGRWWSQMRLKLLFQSDRRWIKSNNLFPVAISAYKALIGKGPQADFFNGKLKGDRYESYRSVSRSLATLPGYGRFALFIYTEALGVVCSLPIEPKQLDLRDAESSRNGVAFAIGRKDLVTGKAGNGRHAISASEIGFLQKRLVELVYDFRIRYPNTRADIWNMETTLCAFHKHKKGQRYVGYYLDRQHAEIAKMQSLIREGVCWDPLWDYRRECLNPIYLKEITK